MQVKILDPRIGTVFKKPEYATDGSAGIDLVACIDDRMAILPQGTLKVGTGVAIFINNINHVGILLPRSGLGSKFGIILGNTVGVIDSDYQGEVIACLYNRTSIPYVVSPGEKICQLLIIPFVRSNLMFVDDFSHATSRGEGGFGSTGK